MSIQRVPVRVCDGCGTVIETDYYIRIRPVTQIVVQQDRSKSPVRDFCCEACEQWWWAQFPADGP